ncbi:TolB family protein [Aestuariibacter salexigens]|uniref:TolB family protein n=1 Tax=Aestuariibacter salexigens TaxID=226010 RepID=UPI00041303D5|nr:hypothetical protein [Aestuariibacter salexigens]
MWRNALRSFTFSALAISSSLQAQVPGSDILLASISVGSDNIEVSAIKRLTDRTQYDNQPYFLADGKSLYYTAAIESDSSSQMDIMAFDLNTGDAVNLTNSAQSEYSPTPLPTGNGFSTIHVDKDGKQWLWAYENNGESRGKLLDAEPVGYHAWVDEKRVIMFVLGEPHTLQMGNLDSNTSRVVAADIGPSLYAIPGSTNMSFTQRLGSGEQAAWWLMSYNPADDSVTKLIQMPANVTYYTWLTDGSVLLAQGSKLYRWQSASTQQWREVADLTDACGAGITRLAANQQMSQLALVCSRSE